MSSTDLAAAQQRVLARRQQHTDEGQARLQARQSRHASSQLGQLPGPLGVWGRRGLATWDVIKGREGTRPAFRVGQVDAELLDAELLELLKAQVGDALKYFGVRGPALVAHAPCTKAQQGHLGQDWSAEIFLALRAVLFKLSIWDHDASYGAVLQGLRYTDARHRGSVLKSPSRWQKGLYGLLTVGGRYAWNKWQEWLMDREGGYEEPSHRVHLLSRISSVLSTTHSVAALVSFVVFLVNGRYRTLADRLLRLRLAPPSSHVSRQVSFEYLNRQLVWHAFTEFLLFILPLVGISRWRRWLARAWRQGKLLVKRKGSDGEDDGNLKSGELAFLPERTCAICYQTQNPTSASESQMMAVTGASGGVVGSVQTDITNGYETIPCGCVYCFVCLATRIEAEEGEGWVCLRCGETVKECKPWCGDVVEDVGLPSTGKSVTFADDKPTGSSKGAGAADERIAVHGEPSHGV